MLDEAFDPIVTMSPSIDNNVVALIPEQQQVIELINHYLHYENRLVVVTGQQGSGKTTLAHELLHGSSNFDDVLIVDATQMLDLSAILQRIADLLQLPIPEDNYEAIELLQAEAEQLAMQERSLVLVIDQAEQLEADTLNELVDLSLQIPQGLAIVLFGLSGYEKSLETEANEAVVHVLPLEPLTELGAQQLLRQVYSPNQPLPLTKVEFYNVYKHSQGVIGALLESTSDLLLATAGKKLPRNKRSSSSNTSEFLTSITKHMPITHVVVLLLLLVVLLLAFFYKPNQGRELPVEIIHALPEDSFEDSTSSTTAMPDSLYSAPETEETIISLPEFSARNKPQPAVEELDRQTPDNSISDEQVRVEQPKPKLQAQVTPKTQAQTTPANLSDKQKLLAIKHGYAIQLFAGSEKANAERFKQDWQKKLNTSLYVYKTKNKNKSWFVVVAAVYPHRNAAEQAIKNWPTEIQQASPWIREIKVVQESLL